MKTKKLFTFHTNNEHTMHYVDIITWSYELLHINDSNVWMDKILDVAL
jgi:hypothetical protein